MAMKTMEVDHPIYMADGDFHSVVFNLANGIDIPLTTIEAKGMSDEMLAAQLKQKTDTNYEEWKKTIVPKPSMTTTLASAISNVVQTAVEEKKSLDQKKMIILAGLGLIAVYYVMTSKK